MELTARIDTILVNEMPDDEHPDLSYLEQDYDDPSIPAEEAAKYRQQDAERLDAYWRGEWHTIGIVASAHIYFDTPVGGWANKITIRTPGVWNIESDSGEDYFKETGTEQVGELADMLLALGFTAQQIADAPIEWRI